jgi:hypothetical protein
VTDSRPYISCLSISLSLAVLLGGPCVRPQEEGHVWESLWVSDRLGSISGLSIGLGRSQSSTVPFSALSPLTERGGGQR